MNKQTSKQLSRQANETEKERMNEMNKLKIRTNVFNKHINENNQSMKQMNDKINNLSN